jgi:cellulose synthase/poly-beta-1,6-N-acetylglucosamine synthase-like glycosyltransferase
MNYRSRWYAVHQVLEYAGWFTSRMAFQAHQQFVPLGGNTVFIRAEMLERAHQTHGGSGPWPISLTEDCALGVLLSARFSAQTAAYYEPRLATQEEVPDTFKGLFFQRVRWFQGFFDELNKGFWRKLPTLRQRFLAFYILANPSYLALSAVMVPITIYTMFQLKAPVALVLLMYTPLVPMVLILATKAIYLHDFGVAYGLQVRPLDYAKLVATHFPYQLILVTAGFWAAVRHLLGRDDWYKTTHKGLHRDQSAA